MQPGPMVAVTGIKFDWLVFARICLKFPKDAWLVLSLAKSWQIIGLSVYDETKDRQ